MAKVLIETYGCTLNQADSALMGGLLEKAGHTVEYGSYASEHYDSYDLVVVNTCTVKTPTEQKILNRIGAMNSLGTKLIVAGCLAGASQKDIEAAAPNACIINTRSVTRIAEAASEALSGRRVVYSDNSIKDKLVFFSPQSSVIAKVPISEGCLSNCSFCETKFARGPLNSFSEELIIKAIKNSVARGAKEIELTSQDTGAYGIDKKTNIAELLEKATALEGDFKIRLGMLNPEHLHRYFDRLVEVYKSDKLYKFVHLPVQSGSNCVLKSMKRNYTIEEFKRYVEELRSKVKGISVETDIIVGYPTETRDDFEESISLLQSIRPEVTNISKFGARPHAPASKLKQLKNSEIKARSIEISRLARQIQAEQRSALVGTVQKVLVTEENARSFTGRTDSYISVALEKGSANISIGAYTIARIRGSTSACLLA
ncbi:MAG: tRNA (N(6)-L-threonylcarbamoyladenosine(37)-C(2))-methylthiotransferase [Candidatus Micrarchaeaceae archaeon]